VATTSDASAVDGAAGVLLLAADDFGCYSARWLTVRLSSLEEEAAVLVDSLSARSRDGGIVRKDRGEA
jgi:hypothetical protein